MLHLVLGVLVGLRLHDELFHAAVDEGELPVGDVGLQQPVRAMGVEGVAQPGAPCAPGAEVIAQAPALELDGHLARPHRGLQAQRAHPRHRREHDPSEIASDVVVEERQTATHALRTGRQRAGQPPQQRLLGGIDERASTHDLPPALVSDHQAADAIPIAPDGNRRAVEQDLRPGGRDQAL